MEDEGSGDRRRAAEALVSPPPRAKTVTIPEARDFIIPHAADQCRCSGFEVAEGTRPFLSVSLSLSADLDRRLSISHRCFLAVTARGFADGFVGARTSQRWRWRPVRGRAAGHAGLHPEERRAAQGRAARALLLRLATARGTWRR